MLSDKNSAIDSSSLSMQHDHEKAAGDEHTRGIPLDTSSDLLGKYSIWRKLATYGIELRGVQPVPVEERTDTRFLNIFTWLSTSLWCLLPLTTGILGTLVYGLSLRDSSLVILFFSFLTAAPPCYMLTLAPQTGMRQMIQARYSFGYYPNILAVVLNMCGIMGFSMIALIVGAQCLVAMSSNSLSTNSGIVIIALISMLLTITGYKIMHIYLRFAWIPTVIALIICCRVGGHHLKEQAPAEPATARSVITFASLIAGYMLPFASTLGDYAVYMPPSAPRLRIFLYALFGLCLPSVLLMVLGAAIGASVPEIPAWNDAYTLNSIGGVMLAMLEPAGGFGKFVTFVLALSVVSNISASVYSVSLNFQILLPGIYRVPRIFLVILTIGILIGVGIGAAERFIDSLEGFLGIISYWAAEFVGIQVTEWIIFRHMDPTTFNPEVWNNWRALPSGWPAFASLILPFGVAVPFMDQIWYLGPVAVKTGDLGFEILLIISPFFYYALRKLEIKFWGGHL